MRKHESSSEIYEIGIDIGGTFTDFVARDLNSGLTFTDKVFTTPDRPADAVIAGLKNLRENFDVRLESTRRILHATTLATNALIEMHGATTGLLTTKGFEDVLDIRKGLRYDQYDLKIQLPKPYAPRFLRRGISERVLASGEISRPVDSSEVVAAAKELLAEGVNSLAICFLHSYANPENELGTERILREKFPDLSVSTSSRITSQAREYERASTVVVDAYIKPLIKNYIEDLKQRLEQEGFAGKLYIMTCGGGVVNYFVAKEIPVLLLESGPVAGVFMSSEVARISKIKGVFSFDMGGTTAKGCIIRDYAIEKSNEFEAARIDKFRKGSGITISIPVVRLIETGSGGGSICRVDSMGLVRVGPQSAGAVPGPACYARGGVEATVTDADLVLGYLDPDYFLGGKVKLDLKLAREAIEKNVCERNGMNIEEAAWAIHDRVNEDVASAFRLYASEIGVDYRNYSFIAFGGAGPVHACRIASKLGCSRIVIPKRAGLLSAEGLLSSPLSFDTTKTRRVELGDLVFESYSREFHALIDSASSKLGKETTAGSYAVKRRLDMCYHGQGYEITIDLKGDQPLRSEFLKLKEIFEKKYKERFGLVHSGSPEIVSFKVSVIMPAEKFNTRNKTNQPLQGTSSRRAYDSKSSSFIKFKVIPTGSLKVEKIIKGPALLQEIESTAVVPSGYYARRERSGTVSIQLSPF